MPPAAHAQEHSTERGRLRYGALKRGHGIERELGVNPFKVGMVGATKSHAGMATAQEDTFFGTHSGLQPELHRRERVVIEAPDPALSS
ncbi:DUF3604 domain-containing protein [Salipiger pacificus]|nr:DUF3604 domain-containing protein [Alloyangia pacifica]MCA0945038.1 DUF3604 domain-containing protein [Alloyangia pacifica]